jgi:hypothetical protein
MRPRAGNIFKGLQLYPCVDLQPELSLTSLDTGIGTPAEFIARDIDVARQRHFGRIGGQAPGRAGDRGGSPPGFLLAP